MAVAIFFCIVFIVYGLTFKYYVCFCFLRSFAKFQCQSFTSIQLRQKHVRKKSREKKHQWNQIKYKHCIHTVTVLHETQRPIAPGTSLIFTINDKYIYTPAKYTNTYSTSTYHITEAMRLRISVFISSLPNWQLTWWRVSCSFTSSFSSFHSCYFGSSPLLFVTFLVFRFWYHLCLSSCCCFPMDDSDNASAKRFPYTCQHAQNNSTNILIRIYKFSEQFIRFSFCLDNYSFAVSSSFYTYRLLFISFK